MKRAITAATKAAKATSFYILLFVALTVCSKIEAQAAKVNSTATISRQDMKAIKKYTRQKFHGYKVKVAPAEKTPDSVITSRKGKRIIYIDQFQTKSRGRYGVVTNPGPFNGNHMYYAKPHKRGQNVTVYLIYDPANNYSDGVIATIEKGRIYKAE